MVSYDEFLQIIQTYCQNENIKFYHFINWYIKTNSKLIMIKQRDLDYLKTQISKLKNKNYEMLGYNNNLEIKNIYKNINNKINNLK